MDLPPRAARRAACAAALLVLLLAASPSPARDDRDPSTSGADELYCSPQQRDAIQAAAQWIDHKKNPGGSWGSEQGTLIADTALCALALMGAGNTLGPGRTDRMGGVLPPTQRGPYAGDVLSALVYLADRAAEDRGDHRPGYISLLHESSRMHGHGFATLALAEACGNLGAGRIEDIRARIAAGVRVSGLSQADRIRYGLHLAVALTQKGQDRDTGGWFYEPNGEGHEGSMTVTQITALRAALDAGEAVSKDVIDKAYQYVRKSQNKGNRDLFGGFAYQIDKPEKVSVALTAAALTTFFELGHYGEKQEDSALIDAGMKFLDRKVAEETFGNHQQWYYYRLFYLAQALYLSGDDVRVRRWWPKIRNEVLERQNPDGSFSRFPDNDRSEEYCTAMGALILEVPTESLPIFQRR